MSRNETKYIIIGFLAFLIIYMFITGGSSSKGHTCGTNNRAQGIAVSLIGSPSVEVNSGTCAQCGME